MTWFDLLFWLIKDRGGLQYIIVVYNITQIELNALLVDIDWQSAQPPVYAVTDMFSIKHTENKQSPKLKYQS